MLEAPRRIDRPEPGFFKLRMRSGGVFVPAIIFLSCPMDPYTGEQLDRHRCLMAAIGNDEPDFEGVDKVWMFGSLIRRSEYLYMQAVKSWAETYAPTAPEASPLEPIDHFRTPINF